MLLRRLASWAQCPGNDFDRPWAAWLLESDMVWKGWTTLVYRPIAFLACLTSGHQVIDDHCGKPAHRYCIVCGRIRPNMPLS